MGSGTIVDAAGLILTVNYVVMGAETLHVTLGRGRALRAEIVAQDFEIGLALLRVKRQGLPAVQIADSQSLERGAPVFAIGSIGPRERRVAGGLVTYLGEFEAYWEYMLDRGIVSSAANPGFGGGPLFTLSGKMVGVVSLNLNEIARCSLSIPSECYRRNRDEFVRFGRVVSRPQRAWLGVFAHVLDEGVVVAGVVPNGPGARSGIQEGDVIVSLDAREVPTRKELYLSLWRHAPGEKMTLEVMRDNEVRRLSVTAGDRADFYKQIP
jgi:S1-C subfamily serine protease